MDLRLQQFNAADDPAGTLETDPTPLVAFVAARLRRDLEKERHLDQERQLRRRPREGSKRGER